MPAGRAGVDGVREIDGTREHAKSMQEEVSCALTSPLPAAATRTDLHAAVPNTHFPYRHL